MATVRSIGNLSSKATCRIIGGALDLCLGGFPPVVRIETTNACNARCTICPHRQLTRPIRQMDDELFTRIVDECAAADCREIHLHNFGEPLLDKQLERRVRYAKQKGIKKVKIFCNGSLITEPRARSLIEAGLDEIKISFDGATREEFERIRVPLKFDRVVENVKNLVALRGAMGSRMRIKAACCSTTDREATMRSLEKIVDSFSFARVHNWGGDNGHGPPEDHHRVRKPCSRLWRTFTILVSGDVALCCLDYDGQHLLGRVDADTSIAEVWQRATYREVRLRHKQARQGEIRLCRNCSKSFL